MSSSKIAVVTGSSRGIGRAIAGAFSQNGIEVVGIDIDNAPNDACSRTLQIDLSKPNCADELAKQCAKVDILVNNAAILIVKPVGDYTADDIDSLNAVNFRAPVLLSQAVLPGMIERGAGRIVNIASAAARNGGFTECSVYAGTKAAVIAFTKSMARQCGPRGITVNAIAPGSIVTDQVTRESSEETERRIASLPVGRLGSPDDITAAVMYLVSDNASYITGATLDVNGGQVMP